MKPILPLFCLAVLGAAAPAAFAQQRVDILVAYTPAARAYAGSTNAMKAAINTYVAATNTAYLNSDVNVVLKLAGTAEVAYTESSSLQTDLTRLTSTTDSYLTTVASLRNNYAADLVCLIRRNAAANVAGIAWLGNLTSGFNPNAYSVVADLYAVGNNSFPHELGHNYGCHHDHANGSGAPRVYAYGHRFNGSDGKQYRTVMAYAPGTRLSYFSNPSILYKNRATGVSGTGATAADNARLLEESAVVTSGFRNGSARLDSMVVANLDNTGSADLLFNDTKNGDRHLWIMNNRTISSSAIIGNAGLEWRVVGGGDFNGDGKTDLIFENGTTAARVVWFMNGTTRTGTANLPAAGANMRLGAVGDFNADGKADLVFENTSTGVRTIWLMNGAARTAAVNFLTFDAAARIVGAADFNRDGKTDLVVEHTTSGLRTIWWMNGTARISATNFGTTAVVWHIAGVGDFNRDNWPDLAFENTSTKVRSVWYMSGATQTTQGVFPTPGATY